MHNIVNCQYSRLSSLLVARCVASPKASTNFWFDHFTACNKFCVVGGELNSLRAHSVREASAYWSRVQFSEDM